ncbi:hypothetical protein N7532_004155 [Penicillium argentinense]|uniref:N-acetyltransferase domain-containing protein n=1 Tax=Penicillium argentinense TaxID=1131581 RepID=A0A9W9FNQ0_9EURO|nr:uncharacterized protein N7532_004155 [Penicillium argentinense]KAJ5103626.1 hypothetical protein N7532_004155 [Penicillium argentinense]
MALSNLQKRVGQLFAVGFQGHTLSPEIKTLIRDFGVGGIVLFSRNFSDAAQLQALTLALQNEARQAGHERPLLIGIDQENGLVTRISPPIAAQVPGPMALGATHDPEFAYQAGKSTGEILGFFGINMNYGPVCDVNSEPLNPVIGVRSPGDDPEFVGRFASATLRGLRELNIIPSVKHFPGHGDTAVDSHYGLPVISKGRDELERLELIPFRRAVAEGVETVMTAHISLPEIDDTLPATLSPKVLGILRKDMAYDGMIITDCLEMDGIRATYGTEQGAVLAIQAGSDSCMICHTFERQTGAIQKICEAVESGAIDKSRLEEAYRRVTSVKERLNWNTALRQNDLATLERINKRISASSYEAYARSVTLVREKCGALPLSKTSNIVVLFPGDGTPAGGAVDGEGMGRQGSYEVTPYLEAIRAHNPSATELKYGEAGLSAEQCSIVKDADAVVFISLNARESPYQKKLGHTLPGLARTLITIAACNPYDFLEVSDIETYLTTYEPTIEAFTVAADIIFGKSVARGSLHVGPTVSRTTNVTVGPYDAGKDVDGMIDIWVSALPTYSLPRESLRALFVRHNAHHFVARLDSKVVGFCLAYLNADGPPKIVHVAVLAVTLDHQNRGIGTSLLTETRSFFRKQYGIENLKLGSSFPRFWPGVPSDLGEDVQNFFTHRGWRLSSPSARSLDLYQDIRNFQSPEKYMSRAKEGGFRFAPLQPEDYEACLVGQRKNFSDKQGWVEAFVKLHPSEYPNSVMVAFDSQNQQVGWTLMLSDPSVINYVWAFPQMCGPNTGLIGCVGVNEEHRRYGIGLAMVSSAVENMKQRGVEGVFVDWVALDGYYEKAGFATWRSYRPGEI